MDVATGKKSRGRRHRGRPSTRSASWTPDGRRLLLHLGPRSIPTITIADRPGFAEVRFHKLGDDPQKDVTVVKRADRRSRATFVGGRLSRDGHWLLLRGSPRLDARPTSGFSDQRKPARSRGPGRTLVGRDATRPYYSVEAWQGSASTCITNEGAPRCRCSGSIRASPSAPPGRRSSPSGRTPRSTASTSSAGTWRSRYLRNAASQIEVRELDGKLVREVTLPASAASAASIGNQDEDEAYFVYTSFTEPTEIYKTSMQDRQDRRSGRKVKLPVDTEPLRGRAGVLPVEGRHARSRCSSSTARTSSATARAPTLLYGYGGFNVIDDAGVHARRICPVARARRRLRGRRTCAAAASTARSGTAPACC